MPRGGEPLLDQRGARGHHQKRHTGREKQHEEYTEDRVVLALRHEVRLPTARWRQVLAPGDPVLGLHMPPGSPLDFALCGESLQGALEFFPRHYPDQPFRAFACESWLLDQPYNREHTPIECRRNVRMGSR